MRYRVFLAMFAGAALTHTAVAVAGAKADARAQAEAKAEAEAAPQVEVSEAWVRGAVPQQRATGAFMRLRAGAPLRLVGASSPVAGRAEVHEMRMEGDLMRMRQIDSLPIPAGETVQLRPGGYHIMLLELKRQPGAGERIPLRLEFEDAERRRFGVEVQAQVRALGAGP